MSNELEKLYIPFYEHQTGIFRSVFFIPNYILDNASLKTVDNLTIPRFNKKVKTIGLEHHNYTKLHSWKDTHEQRDLLLNHKLHDIRLRPINKTD